MKKIAALPLFVFLLPIFFVIHGFVENIGFISLADCLPLLGIYVAAAGVLLAIFYWFYRDWPRAALMSFYLLCFFLFFGVIHDFLTRHAAPMARYGVLLTLFAVGGIALFLYLRKKGPSRRLVLFLNCLFLVYLLVDAGQGIAKTGHAHTPQPQQASLLSPYYTDTGSSSKPDIYLLLFDEYIASRTLQSVYHYDNGGLDSFLEREGFYLPRQCRSNYYYTTYSMSSMLNLSYLTGIHPEHPTRDDNADNIEKLRTNAAVNFLIARGYTIINNSPWDLPGHPGRLGQPFIPLKLELITRRTLVNYISRDIGWWFAKHWKGSTAFMNDNITRVDELNKDFLASTLRECATTSPTPRFVYMHVLMPHFYYLYDSLGRRRSLDDIRDRPSMQWDPERYLEYLPYVNARIREVITTIKQQTGGKAVILFMSDHGFRYDAQKRPQPYFFYNQNAVYLPDGDYSRFYDSITNVNQFRALFDKLFHLNLPMLKDSVVVLQATYDND